MAKGPETCCIETTGVGAVVDISGSRPGFAGPATNSASASLPSNLNSGLSDRAGLGSSCRWRRKYVPFYSGSYVKIQSAPPHPAE